MKAWLTHDRYGYSIHFKNPIWEKTCEVYTRYCSAELDYLTFKDILKFNSNEWDIAREYNFCQKIEIEFTILKGERDKKIGEKISYMLSKEEEKIRIKKFNLSYKEGAD